MNTRDVISMQIHDEPVKMQTRQTRHASTLQVCPGTLILEFQQFQFD